MNELVYPAKFLPEKKGFSISFPDFPEANSQGDSREEAYRMAIDCLQACIEWRLEDKEDVPAPSAVKRGQIAIPVPLEIAPKLALYRLMREKKYTNVRLAAELHVTEPVIRRMLDPKHKSRAEQYTRALMALGSAIQVSVVSMAK